MKRSTLARTLFAAVAAAGIVVSAACSSDSSDAVSEATESAASVASDAADAAQSAASDASEAAGSALEDAGSAAAEATSAAADAIDGAGATIGDTVDATLPNGDTAAISTEASKLYEEAGGAAGGLGAVQGPTEQIDGGTVTPFEGGTIFTSADGAYIVQGEILRVYGENGGPEGALGFPTGDEATIANGWESTFQKGTITWTETDGNFGENVTVN